MNTKNGVYLKSLEFALQNNEIEIYDRSYRMNAECAKAIDNAIHNCSYEPFRYNMKKAVNFVMSEYGSFRMNWVLANTLQQLTRDGRLSSENKEWAKSLDIPQEDYNLRFLIKTHPALLDGFVKNFREVCATFHKDKKPSIIDSIKETAVAVPATVKKDSQKKENGLEV